MPFISHVSPISADMCAKRVRRHYDTRSQFIINRMQRMRISTVGFPCLVIDNSMSRFRLITPTQFRPLYSLQAALCGPALARGGYHKRC